MLEKIWDYLDSHEYFLLIASHVTMLIFYPFVINTDQSLLWMHILISLILVTGLYAANTHERFVIKTLLLGFATLVLSRATYIYSDAVWLLLSLNTVGLLFFCVILYNLIMDLHQIEDINQHMIFGAVAGYLILGLIGAFVFALIEINIPGSFGGFAGTSIGFPDFIYYSYVSMTTLGYGDIIPVGYHAQSRSILFTIGGQMYLAVLIGMLVGKYVRK